MWKNILVPHDFSPCADRALRLAVELARVHRAEIAEPLRREGLAVLTKAVTGICGDEILVAARELGTDVLVVGTHGRTGLSHFWLGSVAEELVRRASIPVLTVRVPSAEAEPTIEERDAEDELAG